MSKILKPKKQVTSIVNPVVIISRSNKNVLLQVLDNTTKKSIHTVNSNNFKKISKTDKAIKTAELLAKYLSGKKIKKVVFDRNRYLYHGRVAAIAQTLRDNKIEI